MKNKITKSHVTIMEFAFRKMVYTTSVYSAIEQGKIKPNFVGSRRMIMIDLRKYGSYKFQVRNPDKVTLIKWYVSVDFEIKGEKIKRKLMGKYGLKRHELTKQKYQQKVRTEKYKTLNGFTEWCYNCFVALSRKAASSYADIYYETLQNHCLWNLKGKQFQSQRAKAKELLQRILKAVKSGSAAQLPYVGEEGRCELDYLVGKYEKQLREEGHPEKAIKKLIILKRKEYKSQFF